MPKQENTAVSLQKLTDAIEHGFKDNKKSIDGLTKKITEHNGRLTKVESWKLKIEGGKIVLKTIWGIGGVVVVAGFFGLWNMYIEVSGFSQTLKTMELQQELVIKNKVRDEVSTYFDNE